SQLRSATERSRAARKTTATRSEGDEGPKRLSPVERAAAGKAARAKAPLESHADFQPKRSRDPVALLLSQAKTRVPDLVPIRHGRMLVSPFTFYRGAALIMAADLKGTPTPGLRTQLCGDAHLSNFGAYASPERRLVFDINDFDETLPGPFEWDVKRLAASFVVAGRENGFTKKQYRKATLAAVQSYRTAMRAFAAQPILTVWYAHLEIEQAIADYKSTLSARQLKELKARIKATEGAMAKARTRDSLQAIGKLSTVVDGKRQITSNPPLIVRLDDMIDLDPEEVRSRLGVLIDSYRKTLQSDRRRLIDHFSLIDIAHKVVGVGSVGTRAWILLMESGVEGEALLLQAKQAGPSALAAYAGESEYRNDGERVVAGQHLMQASSDIFLGWLRARPTGGRYVDYYLRQLRDWKMSAVIEEMIPPGMLFYAQLCGWTLARAHARAGDRISIAAYLGNSARFDNAVADFAETYADQNERDHAALAAAVEDGRVEAQPGV
ncbi:MAG TPA: DUF2252 domain-containing protein, partial [Propionibacteriaceae bacterium]|nr:DUF2252 domain-containing protein [Propionibacteriaceae bacterium]